MNAVPAAVLRGRVSRSAFAFRGLWSQPDFLRLWTAQSISLFGSEITVIALPLTAVLVLGASPAQMGLLAAAGKAPYLLVEGNSKLAASKSVSEMAGPILG